MHEKAGVVVGKCAHVKQLLARSEKFFYILYLYIYRYIHINSVRSIDQWLYNTPMQNHRSSKSVLFPFIRVYNADDDASTQSN